MNTDHIDMLDEVFLDEFEQEVKREKERLIRQAGLKKEQVWLGTRSNTQRIENLHTLMTYLISLGEVDLYIKPHHEEYIYDMLNNIMDHYDSQLECSQEKTYFHIKRISRKQINLTMIEANQDQEEEI